MSKRNGRVNGSLKIEDGIEMPLGGGRYSLFRQMRVGQSVLVPIADRAHANTAAVRAFGTGKYKTRAEGTSGLRIWRTA